jgi:hypothetical protein
MCFRCKRKKKRRRALRVKAGGKLVAVRVKDMFALSLHNVNDEHLFTILSLDMFA